MPVARKSATSEPRSRTATSSWLVVACLAVVGALLAFLLRADPVPPPAMQPTRGAAKTSAEPELGGLTVAAESERESVGTESAGAITPADRRGSARVLAVDDNLRPVPGVEVWLARRPSRGDGFDASPPNLCGVTGADGAVEFGDLPLGKHLVHARHEMLVHSHRRRSQMRLAQPDAVLIVGDTPAELTVYLSMPVVCGVGIVGLPIFYDSFLLSGAGYHTPTNGDGHWSCRRTKERLQDAFPGSVCIAFVKDFEPPAPSGRYGSCLITAWSVGYEAFRQDVRPVPLDLFEGPLQIGPSDLRPSDQFGTVRITVNGAGGVPVEDLQFTIGTPMAVWRDDRPEVHSLRVATGEPVALPVGTYDLCCEGDFQRQHPALTRRNLEVEQGKLTEVVIDSPIPWSRCRFDFRGAGEERALTGGGLVLKHVESNTSVTKLISHFDPPIELWLPEGEYVVRATAFSADHEMIWRHEDEVISVAGGSLESPQLVAREMHLVRR